MLLLLAGDQYVVLVFALLDGAVPEGGDAIAVLAIVIPLSLVSVEQERERGMIRLDFRLGEPFLVLT